MPEAWHRAAVRRLTAPELRIPPRREAGSGVARPEPGRAGWTIDFEHRRLTANAGKIVHLTHAEWRILILLAGHPHQPITRDRLMMAAVCRGWSPLDRSIDVHISNLRRKLDADPQQPSLIRAVRGVGYMFVPDGSDWTIA